MNKFRSYSYLVLGVAVTLAIVGISICVLVPPRMEERGGQMARARAKATAQYVAAYASRALSSADTSQIADAVKLVRLDPDLALAIVAGAEEDVIAASSDSIAVGSKWSAAMLPYETTIEWATVPIVQDGWLRATVFVGMGKEHLSAEAAGDRGYIYGLGIFLLVLGCGVGFGVWQLKALREAVLEWQKRHRNLRMHTGSLQSSVKEHRQTERALKESEEKYKSLFESTMEQAMRDLEELNRHLERRKVDLEHEVAVRKRAEAALRRYAERLKVMNEVERTMLEGRGLDESVEQAMGRLREIVEAGHVSLIEIDAHSGSGRILGVAADGELAVGASREMAGMDFGAFAKGSNQIRYVQNLAEREAKSRFETRLEAGGVTSYCHVPLVIEEETVGVLNMAAERVSAFSEEDLGIARDVADLLAIGIRQARMNEERVRYEAELIAAKERAEEMARLKSAFLTNMSHEIRTPISGIMGFSQVLHDEVPDPLREFTGLIREAANRLLNTINSVLELARLESDSAGATLSVVNVGDAAVEATEALRPEARRKGLSLDVERPGEECWSELDLASVERIVTNLVDNAIKFTPEGSVRVRVAAEASEVVLKIEDTGVGMAEEFLPKLFDEFRQEQMDANREHEGSGLGLAITKKLVDRLGGTIRVESGKGEGTQFEVRFPKLDTSRKMAKNELGAEVVIVSGNEETARLLGKQLERVATTRGARDLSAAQAALDGRSAIAVVVDVNTAGTVDSEGIAAMRSASPSLRILAMASQVLPENVEDVLAAGFDRFVVAPFDGRSLAAAVRGEELRQDRAARRATDSGARRSRGISQAS